MTYAKKLQFSSDNLIIDWVQDFSNTEKIVNVRMERQKNLYRSKIITCTVDSRYLEFKGISLKHFEISISRHMRVERVRKTIN